jgi:glycerol-3-phosphate dehydrogenase (NAD(P)+)
VKATIIGDGGWGTALALVLRTAGHEVTVWGPFPDYIADVRSRGENPLYLPGVALPPDMGWTADRDEAAHGAALAVLASPTQYFREVVASFRGRFAPGCRFVSVAKGLEADTYRTMTEVACSILGVPAVAALSGPSHAGEVARGVPTAVVAACGDDEVARLVQTAFTGERFRVYTSSDPLGVQVGGALKNVIALAVGVSDGLGFGDNTRAALITRGLVEMTRVGVSLGSAAETFAGLSGMGDLIVTCTSRHSRNRGVGEKLGRGEALASILAGMKQVAEGVKNCPVALALARRQGVEVPIIAQVHAVLHEGRRPGEAVRSLMQREARPESDGQAGS